MIKSLAWTGVPCVAIALYTYTKFYLFKAQLRRYSSQAIKKQNTYQLCPYMDIRYKPQFDNS